MSTKNLANELHKQVTRKFERRKVRVFEVDEIWAMDLVDLQSFEKENNGFKYTLNVIDCFSKYAWIEPLKSKTGEEVLKAFKKILEMSKRKPKKLWTDEGSEFYNKKFKKFIDDENIEIYSVFNENKSSIVERFNRTIKTKMFRYFTQKGNYRWIDEISKLVSQYNKTFHRTIQMSPIDGSKDENKSSVFNNVNKFRDKKIVTKLKVGDMVRISRVKGKFEKGFTQNWSNEVFEIYEVVLDQPVVYKLKDVSGDKINGSFYEQELQKTKEDMYFIEDVIKTKVVKGVKFSLVKWRGYDKPTWILSSDVKDI